jgi:hypothetical protein
MSGRGGIGARRLADGSGREGSGEMGEDSVEPCRAWEEDIRCIRLPQSKRWVP